MGCDLEYAGRYAEGAQHDFMISRKNRHRAHRATNKEGGTRSGVTAIGYRQNSTIVHPAGCSLATTKVQDYRALIAAASISS